MGDVLRWIATTQEEEPTELLESSSVRGSSTALEQLQSVWEADPKFASSAQQTAATALDPWGEPTIAEATAAREGEGITAEWRLSGRNTLYITAPAHDQRRLRGLFTALISGSSPRRSMPPRDGPADRSGVALDARRGRERGPAGEPR